mgnify:CR=1 FL=1
MKLIDTILFIIYYWFGERNYRESSTPYFGASFCCCYLFLSIWIILPPLSFLNFPIAVLILYILLRWRLPKRKLAEFEKYMKTKYKIFLILFIILANLLACTYMIRYKPLG